MPEEYQLHVLIMFQAIPTRYLRHNGPFQEVEKNQFSIKCELHALVCEVTVALQRYVTSVALF